MKEYFLYAYEWIKTIVKIFFRSNCSIHAAGLTYFSLLAIVPLLCIFLIASNLFGTQDKAIDRLHNHFENVASELENAPNSSVTAQVITSEEEMNSKSENAKDMAIETRNFEQKLCDSLRTVDFETVGWIGFIMLLWTVISSISMVEVCFNQIMETKETRSWWKKLLLSFVVLLVLPMLSGLAIASPILNVSKEIVTLIFGATFVTRWFSDSFVWLIDLNIFRIVTTLFFSTLAFAFLYYILPTQKVCWKYALWSGCFAAAIFGIWLKICTVIQICIARYSLIYGSLALLPIFLVWVYVSWQIILIGCCSIRATHICMYANRNRGAV